MAKVLKKHKKKSKQKPSKFSDLVRLFNCKRQAIRNNVEFYIAYILFNIVANSDRREVIPGVGTARIRKKGKERGGQLQMVIDMEDHWDALLYGKKDETIKVLTDYIKARVKDSDAI